MLKNIKSTKDGETWHWYELYMKSEQSNGDQKRPIIGKIQAAITIESAIQHTLGFISKLIKIESITRVSNTIHAISYMLSATGYLCVYLQCNDTGILKQQQTF